MATLDDKLLGEKLHYYCDSSDDERDEENDEKSSGDHEDVAAACQSSSSSSVPNYRSTDGIRLASRRRNEIETMNTGPKGVIRDFQQYKQFENEKRETNERQQLMLLKKLQLSCRSYLDEEAEKKAEAKKKNDDDDELYDENDAFLKEYIAKRMKDMIDNMQNREARITFGELEKLDSGEKFLSIIENKDFKSILIITHVLNRNIPECKRMNECLNLLAKKYPHVKFCSLDASSAGMSHQFVKFGVPALLVYRDGDLIGNFVSLGDEFGRDFNEDDIEDFLVENNILISSQLISSISYNSNLSNFQSKIRQTAENEDDDDDDDL